MREDVISRGVSVGAAAGGMWREDERDACGGMEIVEEFGGSMWGGVCAEATGQTARHKLR